MKMLQTVLGAMSNDDKVLRRSEPVVRCSDKDTSTICCWEYCIEGTHCRGQ